MIYVMRHGQTDLNKEGRLQGRQGLPLNDVGVQQAEVLKIDLNHINFDLVYSSPQERAVQTAEIATGMTPVVDPRLDVFDLGEADGLRKVEVITDGATPDSIIYHGVEDKQDFVKRVFHFMHELEQKYGDSETNILISGHRCTTGAVGAFFHGIPTDQNILKYSSDNGKYQTYSFEKKSLVK
ncbi:histidine phosphatase family protein [Fictibacillus sp. BK138]|uniref:histidine phosphatase family protein n=1 Tax=Fictibacillus sp. BK138 TaxID=2512121 RepID=UPI001029E14A|nr:histidine phosphatase family protein [Fictibacillus sp. BK138]RZT23566.1 putative phosphoglycerate mutase [Fictibacillus sp. BK138]